MSFRKPNREQVGREAGEKHIYLHIPDGMAECVFDLEFLAFKYVDEKDFFVAEFKVIATDTPVKAGKTISVVLNPRQKLAEVYFYRDLYNIRLALRGKTPSGAARDKLAAKQDTSVEGILKVLEGLEGRECRAVLERYTNKLGEPARSTSWLPAEDQLNE